MKILLCNDDGIHAQGIIALAEKLCEFAEVFVAAPDSERSAASNSLTLSHPLRVRDADFPAPVKKAWAISGTPSDCAKIAMSNLIDTKPDFVVSGINRGPNLCVDIFYSGTVAAAFEGAFKGIPSFAVSLDDYNADASYEAAAAWGANCIKSLIDMKPLPPRVYNINVPGRKSEEIKGVKITRSGTIDYKEQYDHRLDPYGKSYYWIMGNPEIVDNADDCDVVAVRNGYVSVTPLKADLTDHSLYSELKNRKF
jgi:5'-nucleotidase